MHVTRIYLNELVFWQSFDDVWIKDQYIYSASNRCSIYCILIIVLLMSHVVDLRNRIFNSIKSASSSVPPCGSSKSSNLSFLLKRYGPSRMMRDKDCGQKYATRMFELCNMQHVDFQCVDIQNNSWFMNQSCTNMWVSKFFLNTVFGYVKSDWNYIYVNNLVSSNCQLNRLFFHQHLKLVDNIFDPEYTLPAQPSGS